MFSSRLPGRLALNPLSLALEDARRSGAPLLDLTATNPTTVDLPYPQGVLAPLADDRSLVYAPDPRGLAAARAAVARDFARRGVTLAPDRIVLTASTSEAYGLLFKLLCDPGDAVLVPRPSYPLFELLTGLEGVEARPYRLEYHGAWSIDRPTVEQAMTARARALLVVSPNNPTGSFLRGDDREWLAELCASRGMAIVSDEVFGDYPIAPRPDACGMAGETRALTFALGGLSKSAGLPQVKLGWIGASGPDDLVEAAMVRLDVICDSYLSVSTPVQMAAAGLIDAAETTRVAIRERLAVNLASLRRHVAGTPSVTMLEPEGGWSAVLRVPDTEGEEALALRILADARVIVHPGYFFDFASEAYLVVSLLPPPGVFDEAIGRLLAAVAEGPH
jgi:alanine-synthesizing transaminase